MPATEREIMNARLEHLTNTAFARGYETLFKPEIYRALMKEYYRLRETSLLGKIFCRLFPCTALLLDMAVLKVIDEKIRRLEEKDES